VAADMLAAKRNNRQQRCARVKCPAPFVPVSMRETGTKGALRGTTIRTQLRLVLIPADVSWEPDLWGRVRNTACASQYFAQASAAGLENATLIKQAGLAEYFLEIRRPDEPRKILDEAVAAVKKAEESERPVLKRGRIFRFGYSYRERPI
jgi:outer membrane protein TolC